LFNFLVIAVFSYLEVLQPLEQKLAIPNDQAVSFSSVSHHVDESLMQTFLNVDLHLFVDLYFDCLTQHLQSDHEIAPTINLSEIFVDTNVGMLLF